MGQSLDLFCRRYGHTRLLDEWDAERNAPLTPQQVTAGTRRKVWWTCAKGHSWQASVASRVSQKTDCPVCGGKEVQRGFNDLASLYPALVGEWDAAKNGALTPETVTPASNRKVWWRCPLGHVWKAVIYSRAGTQRCGCPVCGGKGRRKNIRYDEILAESAAAKGKADVRRM